MIHSGGERPDDPLRERPMRQGESSATRNEPGSLERRHQEGVALRPRLPGAMLISPYRGQGPHIECPAVFGGDERGDLTRRTRDVEFRERNDCTLAQTGLSISDWAC